MSRSIQITCPACGAIHKITAKDLLRHAKMQGNYEKSNLNDKDALEFAGYFIVCRIQRQDKAIKSENLSYIGIDKWGRCNECIEIPQEIVKQLFAPEE